MKTLLILFAAVLILVSCSSGPAPISEPATATAMPETTFDSTLAAQLGADQYGMRKYVMAFLKKGPNRDRTKEQADSLQRAHMDNIIRMAEAGKLVVAGPFFDDGEVRGIYIFAVNSLEEAEALTNTDPAIQAGSLEMELREWYGSAALMQVNEVHKRVQKEGI
ncbi:MAG: YciI family protein [Flavobacteriales bacterium]|nr:YciI family protein [Flavobacteriales bacterium]